jgi:hypothetical protein
MNKKLNTYFDKARKMQGKPLIEEAEIRNRLGNKSKFSDKIIFPKMKGVTKMAIFGSSFAVLVVALFLLFNPLHDEKDIANTDKKIITKEHTYDVDEKLSKEQAERNVLLDDTDDINKDQIPILRLTEDELKRLDIYLSDDGIEFTVEYIYYPEALIEYFNSETIKSKNYPKLIAEQSIIRLKWFTENFRIKSELEDYTGWNLQKSKRAFPVWHSLLYKFKNGKFGSERKEFSVTPVIDFDSRRFINHSFAVFDKTFYSNILDLKNRYRKDIDFNIDNSISLDDINSDLLYNLESNFILLYIENKVKAGTEYHILWFAPTKELIEKLPERYKDIIRERYNLIEDKYVVPDNVKLALDKKWEKDRGLDFVPQKIAGIEKLELTWDELKKIGIRVEDGKLVSNGQEWYFTKNKEKGYLDILRDKKYPINIDSGIFRIKTMIDTISYDMENIKPLEYNGWSMSKASKIMPVAITSYCFFVHVKEDGSQVLEARTTEYIEDKSPLLAQYTDSNDLLNWSKEGFSSKLKLLIPVNIVLGNPNAIDPNNRRLSKINYWFFATEEFVELLPDRYRIPIMKELKMISSVEEGSMSYEEACSALKGESYFGLCTMESENIKNLKIYPNPSFDGEFNLKFDLLKTCKLSFDVYSTDGEKIANIDGIMENEVRGLGLVLELGDSISNGVYLLSISTDLGDMITTKIIIER